MRGRDQMSNLTYNIERKSIYKDVEYTVVSILDNDLLLAVPTKDLENGLFPIQPVIIPDEYQNIK
jgi:hypothetical protein